MAKRLYHYAGRELRHYSIEGKEILIGDCYHDKREFKEKPWSAAEVKQFRNKRQRKRLIFPFNLIS